MARPKAAVPWAPRHSASLQEGGCRGRASAACPRRSRPRPRRRHRCPWPMTATRGRGAAHIPSPPARDRTPPAFSPNASARWNEATTYVSTDQAARLGRVWGGGGGGGETRAGTAPSMLTNRDRYVRAPASGDLPLPPPLLIAPRTRCSSPKTRTRTWERRCQPPTVRCQAYSRTFSWRRTPAADTCATWLRRSKTTRCASTASLAASPRPRPTVAAPRPPTCPRCVRTRRRSDRSGSDVAVMAHTQPT